jgi:hypothetical protein
VKVRLRATWAACFALSLAVGCALDADGLPSSADGGRDGTMPSIDGQVTDGVAPADGPASMHHGDSTVPGDGSEGSVPGDAGVDAGVTGDAAADASSEAGSDASADSSVIYACPSPSGTTPVSDCSVCKGKVLGCAYCTDGGGLVGVCVSNGSHCQEHAPAGAEMCPCGADAAACPLADQVCLAKDAGCGTCGQNDTNGLECQNGLTCKASPPPACM